MVQTEVTYAPSPRRIGKKKVKLNPVIRKSGGSNCSLGANSPSQNYDKQPPALPVLLPNESEKKNAVVIGGKTKLLRESYIAFIVFDILARKLLKKHIFSKNANAAFSSILEHFCGRLRTKQKVEKS